MPDSAQAEGRRGNTMGMFAPITWSGRAYKWLYFTAILELALAVLFLVIGLNNDILRGGFTLTAAFLGLTGIGLFLWGRRWAKGYKDAQRLRTSGVPGQATIQGMRQTGVYLNEQPQIELNLQVQTQMHGPYQVTVREYVPLMLLGTLSSGRPLPVKVDPADPQKLVIEWESAMSGGMGGMTGGMPVTPPPSADTTMYDPQARQAEKERLLATGVAGRATVNSARATGDTDSEGRPVYELMLTIEIPGQQPIQGPARTGVPPDRVSQLEAGDTVAIKSDPANPTAMTIDWESS
jgi:hypothetical protein